MVLKHPNGVPMKSHVTYAEFGEHFLRQHCNGCHGSGADNRHGAPTAISFDSIEAVWTWKDAILRVTHLRMHRCHPRGS